MKDSEFGNEILGSTSGGSSKRGKSRSKSSNEDEHDSFQPETKKRIRKNTSSNSLKTKKAPSQSQLGGVKSNTSLNNLTDLNAPSTFQNDDPFPIMSGLDNDFDNDLYNNYDDFL